MAVLLWLTKREILSVLRPPSESSETKLHSANPSERSDFLVLVSPPVRQALQPHSVFYLLLQAAEPGKTRPSLVCHV
jgi:hypothetical protein